MTIMLTLLCLFASSLNALQSNPEDHPHIQCSRYYGLYYNCLLKDPVILSQGHLFFDSSDELLDVSSDVYIELEYQCHENKNLVLSSQESNQFIQPSDEKQEIWFKAYGKVIIKRKKNTKNTEIKYSKKPCKLVIHQVKTTPTKESLKYLHKTLKSKQNALKEITATIKTLNEMRSSLQYQKTILNIKTNTSSENNQRKDEPLSNKIMSVIHQKAAQKNSIIQKKSNIFSSEINSFHNKNHESLKNNEKLDQIIQNLENNKLKYKHTISDITKFISLWSIQK